MNYGLVKGLSLRKAVARYRRPRRPISVSAVPFGLGIDIWQSCRFIGALFRSLCALPGGIGRFMPCSMGANHCRLWHFGFVSLFPRSLFRHSGMEHGVGGSAVACRCLRFACVRLPSGGFVLPQVALPLMPDATPFAASILRIAFRESSAFSLVVFVSRGWLGL